MWVVVLGAGGWASYHGCCPKLLQTTPQLLMHSNLPGFPPVNYLNWRLGTKWLISVCNSLTILCVKGLPWASSMQKARLEHPLCKRASLSIIYVKGLPWASSMQKARLEHPLCKRPTLSILYEKGPPWASSMQKAQLEHPLWKGLAWYIPCYYTS